MQGGGMAAVDLAALLIGLKKANAKGDSESDGAQGEVGSGVSSTSGNSSQSGSAGNHNVADVEANRLASEKVNQVTAPIDFDGHILSAEINKKGNIVGGHSNATGNVDIISKGSSNSLGVYEATIRVPDPKNPGQFLTKNSTMFPDAWSGDRIKVEVDAAFKTKVAVPGKPGMWEGKTPSGVKVRGYLSPNVTVFPVKE
jgi:filamentous hemagglutinin